MRKLRYYFLNPQQELALFVIILIFIVSKKIAMVNVLVWFNIHHFDSLDVSEELLHMYLLLAMSSYSYNLTLMIVLEKAAFGYDLRA